SRLLSSRHRTPRSSSRIIRSEKSSALTPQCCSCSSRASRMAILFQFDDESVAAVEVGVVGNRLAGGLDLHAKAGRGLVGTAQGNDMADGEQVAGVADRQVAAVDAVAVAQGAAQIVAHAAGVDMKGALQQLGNGQRAQGLVIRLAGVFHLAVYRLALLA